MDSANEKIYYSDSHLKVVTARNMLEEAGINTFVINKKDTAYAGVFGDIELHVSKEDAEKAREILVEAEIL